MNSLARSSMHLASGCRYANFAAPICLQRLMSTLKSSDIPVAKYGGRSTVTLMPGSGIGPEMMGYVEEVFAKIGAPIDFETMQLNPDDDSYEDLYNAVQSVKRNGCALKGNIETKINLPNSLSRNVEMRNRLDLFVNVLKCKSYPGVKTRHANIDVVLVRQNTEGEYAMLEHENVPGVVESMKVITEPSTRRLCKYAFEYARANNRKKVTLVHKANIMKLTDGLFLEISRQVAKEYPDIEHDDIIIDNCCMQLVSNPWQFDVMILTNLYGTIVSNLLCGLIGGPGLISGANFGDKYALFEPGTRNTGTALTGKNAANPVAMINAAADMLDHLKMSDHASRIRDAVDKTINVKKLHTADVVKAELASDPSREMASPATSRDVVDSILDELSTK